MSKTSELTLYEEYIKFYDDLTEKYGKNKVIALMQVGSFYEAYGTDDLGPDLLEISKLTGVIRSKKGKSEKLSLEHPYCLGFPMSGLCGQLETLTENDYTVAVIDQVLSNQSDKKKREKRQVTQIYTKGTFIENIERNEGNYLVCVYFSRDPQKDFKPLMSVGLTAVDVSTGHVYVHEAYSNKYDEYFAFDEADRFITSLNPREILIYFQNNAKDKEKNFKEKVLGYLKIDNDNCRFIEGINQTYTKCTTQNEILKKVYPSVKSLVSPIERLDLEKNSYLLVSLSMIFEYIHDKNKNLLNNLAFPRFFINSDHLILGNNAISQLDVIERDKANTKVKFKSLFHVVNKTSTAMGERFLKGRLLSPLLDKKKLTDLYDLTEILINKKMYEKIEKYLDGIKDIERLQRKIEMQSLKPIEMSYVLASYENISELVIFIKDTKELKKFKLLLPSESNSENFKKFSDYVNSKFVITELNKYANLDIDSPIFKNGIHPDIDLLTNNADTIKEFMNKLKNSLNKLISATGKEFINLHMTKKTGGYLKLTKSKAEILKTLLYTKKEKVYIGKDQFDTSQLKFVEMESNNVKIILIDNSDGKQNDPKKCKDMLIKLNRKYYKEELAQIHTKFLPMFTDCNRFIANIDFIKSSAKVADLFGYSRPIIVDKSYGYVCLKALRHPIVERIINYEYVCHDIELGEDLKGMMIYGPNGVGKSVIMKAVGLSVIMAQSGLFVPCNSMSYSPYDSLYTRITGDDNIFRGLSSFSLEMVEVNAILKRSGENTLVIGDEVCRGTEHISGNALVASAIVSLSKSNSTFIFASHLHEIMEFKKIKELKNVKPFHISVSYDEKTNVITYDRQLKDGCGDKVYGITVAQHIVHDKKFIDLALEFKNELTNSFSGLISGKVSSYNNAVSMNECYVCGQKGKQLFISNLETHHMNYQKDCENGFVKGKKHLKKNCEANLIVLCTECHDKIHAGKLILDKYVMTTEGRTIIIKEKKA